MAGQPIFNVRLNVPVEKFIEDAPRHPVFEVETKRGAA
jgi:hypothetical protein